MAFVSAVTLLGLIGNVAYTMTRPPVYTSSALVVLAPAVNVSTQTVVVDSTPVLTDALRGTDLGFSFGELQDRVRTTRAGGQMISISARARTAGQAERVASAVARSYIAYITSTRNPLGEQPAQLLRPATTATWKPLTTRVAQAAGLGLLASALLAVVIALAIWRHDRRLRERDAIADSIGVPVLTSVRASAPSDAAGWARLLDGYQAEAGDGWLLRRALRELRAVGRSGDGSATGTVSSVAASSLAVLSLANDRDAVALGPQLAAYAASRGVPTALVVSQRQDAKATAALRAACVPALPRGAGNLLVIASDTGDEQRLPAGMLTVVVSVVDGQTPRVAETMRADVTVLGVAAGAVTAEQLARVAASAAGDGRVIAGILVANPVHGDQTTGCVPQLARPGHRRMPTRMVGVVTESRL
jgi:capsular polysaccharide biosynthesis protein